MDLIENQEENDFRRELKEWLRNNAPVWPQSQTEDELAESKAAWHRNLYDGGWLGLTWPIEYGGKGLPPYYECILNDELGYAGAPPKPYVGYLGRGIAEYGSEDQKKELLPSLLSGDVRWCQGFSEPGAGSDLAAMRTRATASDVSSYRVDGHKIWTSDAQYADMCLLLARTGSPEDRHRGISAFVIPMDNPGISVAPITQASGSKEFCEVFFDAVEVPSSNLIGTEGDGWSVAMTILSYERTPAELGFTSRYISMLDRLEARLRERNTEHDQSIYQRWAECYVEVQVLRNYTIWSIFNGALLTGEGAWSSIDKLLMTSVEQNLYRLSMDMEGAAPLLDCDNSLLGEYFYSRAQSIMGGTSEIQHNIIATRLLGLPKSV
jgi:alkylation response protein AidB-like acyl-CoA dehydrogenase